MGRLRILQGLCTDCPTQKKSYCDIEFTIPVRGIICFLLKKVHYQTDELAWRPAGCSSEVKGSSKKEFNEKEYELLNKLGAIPSNWLVQSKPRVAGFKPIESDTSSNSNSDD